MIKTPHRLREKAKQLLHRILYPGVTHLPFKLKEVNGMPVSATDKIHCILKPDKTFVNITTPTEILFEYDGEEEKDVPYLTHVIIRDALLNKNR